MKQKTKKEKVVDSTKWTIEEKVQLNRTVALIAVAIEALAERIDMIEDRIDGVDERFATKMKVTYNN